MALQFACIPCLPPPPPPPLPVQIFHGSGQLYPIPIHEASETVKYPVNECEASATPPLMQLAAMAGVPGMPVVPNFIQIGSIGLWRPAITFITETRDSSKRITELILNVDTAAIRIEGCARAMEVNCFVAGTGSQGNRGVSFTQPVCGPGPLCNRVVVPFCPPLKCIREAEIYVKFVF